MRTIVLALAAAAAATPLAAQQHGGHQHGGQHHGDHAHHAHRPGELPEGWRVRLDRENAPMDEVRFMAHGDEYLHAVLGPSGIFWRPADAVAGSYVASATFEQMRPPHHPESYGLFVGGRDLEAPGQAYVYFLVRGDGRYMVKHRAGADAPTLVPWTEHPAVRPADAEGRATNHLAVHVEPSGVRFLVNGTEVTRLDPAANLATDGVAGLRINHNLDLKVHEFTVVPAPN